MRAHSGVVEWGEEGDLLEIPGFGDVEPLFLTHRVVGFRAVRTSDGSRVVLKSVAPGTIDTRAGRVLAHEAQILSQLSIPGVVRASGLELTALGQTLVLEDAGPSNLVQEPGAVVSLEWFLDVAHRLAGIIARLHAAGVVHRDIKPGHVVLDPGAGALCLIAFGLATRIPRHSTQAIPLGRLEGTLGYLSPEQTGRMNRAVDWRTDLYSLGVTLYELLIGRLPFESADPLQVLHSTVARAPRPPGELRPDVPSVVSQILLRLLEKDAEDRYQHAEALVDDLERCQAMLRQTGRIDAFEIATTDRRGTFCLPGRLYGRLAAVTTLQDCLRRSKEGASVFLGICGPPGVGKTALARLAERRVGEGGLMAAGVCSPLDGTPYKPIVQVLRSILSNVVHGPKEAWAFHQARLVRAMADDAGLLRGLIPELRGILPRVDDSNQSFPSDGHQRMLALLVRLLRAYHEPDTPLVLFLDDLQWCDPLSLDVIEQLMRSSGSGGPLVLLAWRDDEVGANHPVSRLLRHRIEVLTLGALDVNETGELVADALGLPPEEVAELAQVVHQKTSGHPLFVRDMLSSLVADGLLTFDPARRQWGWALDAILALPPTASFIELLRRGLSALPRPCQSLLGTAACIGKQFELATLAGIGGGGSPDLERGLLSAVQKGLLTGSADALSALETFAHPTRAPVALRFVHDEVYLAALALVPEPERAVPRLAASRILVAAWREAGSSPFPAADLYHAALPLVTDRAERHEVAGLMLAAGTLAADSQAFRAALRYFETGILALGDNPWASSHEVAFALHLRAAEAVRMCPDYAAPTDFIAQGMAGTSDVLERISLQRVRVLGHAGRYEFDAALRLTLQALAWVGVRLPVGAHRGHVAMALLRTGFKVRGKTLAELQALPANSDRRVVEAMQLLADTASVTYYADPLLLPVLLCRMVDLSLEHGVSGTTAFGCAGWAFLQIVTRDDLATATLWSVFARELIYRFNDRKMAPKVELLVIGFVDAQTKPLASLVTAFQRAGDAAIAVGDAEYAALHAMNQLTFSLLGGVDLHEVTRRGKLSLQLCRDLSQEQAVNSCLMALQVAECLSGRAPNPGIPNGSFMDEEAMTARMTACGDKSGLASLLLYRVHLGLLFGDSAARLAAVEAALLRLADLPGAPQVPPFMLHAALVWVGHMRQTGRVGGRPLRQARSFHKKLAAMAGRGAINFAHKARLVEAELTDLGGDAAAAQVMYEDAIRLARASGMLHEEAMCLEWAARAAQRLKSRRLAAALSGEASSAWGAWGAWARVEALDGVTSGTGMGLAVSTFAVGMTGSAGLIEFASVLKASQAVSGEIQIGELLRTLMRVILENAGATWGMLALTTPGPLGERLLVAARAEVEATGGIAVHLHDERVAVGVERPLADAIVRDVARTREAIVVHDGANEPRYFAEVDAPPRSVLCVPVRRANRLVGVVYLENRLARHAFTVARSDVIGVLCSQAAVSIENASLYADLQSAHDRLARVSRQLVEAQETERRAVARELHDETGQVLTALALHLDLAVSHDPSDLGADRTSAQVGVVRARELVGDLIARVRRMSLDLRPVMLDDLGLLPALLWLIDRYTEHTSVRVELVHAGLDRRFPADVETAGFRIVQEALTNVARHSGVASATVSVSADAGHLSIEVTDRGAGFDASAIVAGRSAGVSGMRERATLLGGTFELESGPGGTTIFVQLPFSEAP